MLSVVLTRVGGGLAWVGAANGTTSRPTINAKPTKRITKQPPKTGLRREGRRGVRDRLRLRLGARLSPAGAALAAAQALQQGPVRRVPAQPLPLVGDLPGLPEARGAAAVDAQRRPDRCAAIVGVGVGVACAPPRVFAACIWLTGALRGRAAEATTTDNQRQHTTSTAPQHQQASTRSTTRGTASRAARACSASSTARRAAPSRSSTPAATWGSRSCRRVRAISRSRGLVISAL